MPKQMATSNILHCRVNDTYSVVNEGSGHRLRAADGEYEIDLHLQPTKPPALHGDAGIVDKGNGLANYYYSLSRLSVKGTVRIPGSRTSRRVTGQAWMDHEYGDIRFAKTITGWDWFALQIDDGTELMLYTTRSLNRDGGPRYFGSSVERDGTIKQITPEDVRLEVQKTWRARHGRSEYPVAWRLRIPSLGVDMSVKALVEHTELDGAFPVTYWEGPVSAHGVSSDKQVTAIGFVEMVGYDADNGFANMTNRLPP